MLKSLNLTNFRSYREIKLQIDQPLIVILGPNAVGKTNLLESVHVASTTHSFRDRDREIIHYGEDFYRVEAGFDDHVHEVRFVTEGNHYRKSTLVNSVKRPLNSVVGINPVVIFEPNDMNLLTGPPDLRRRHLDTVLSQIDPEYMAAISTYRRILKQRNSLIHQAKINSRLSNLDDQLFVWNLQILDPATKIIRARRQMIEGTAPLLADYYNKIAATKTRAVTFSYSPSLPDNKDKYLRALKNNLTKDIHAGFTTAGPHRDDFSVEFDGRSVVQAASRGELRTAILALKLAQMDYFEERLTKRPILLLDDVFSELDKSRREFLVGSIDRQQTFITTTDLDKSLKHDYQLIDLSGVGHVA